MISPSDYNSNIPIKLLTNFGIVSGTSSLNIAITPDSIEKLNQDFNENLDKNKIIREFKDIKFVGDGTVLSLENVSILTACNNLENIGKLIIFIDDIIGVIF
jgi:hypothetical protein